MERHPEFEEAWLRIRAAQAAIRRHRVARSTDPRPPERRPGRRSTYTPERARAFCDLLVRGLTLREIAAIPGQPAVAMIYRWLRNHPEFRHDYALALRLREDVLFDHMLDRGRGARPEDWQGARFACWRLKGRIGQLRPDVWTAG